MEYTIGRWLAALFLIGIMQCSPSWSFEELSEQDMGAISGQSLFTSNIINPGGSNPNGDMAFYRLGIDAQIDINANIRRLALGCDGAGGVGPCDIDIDFLALTGMAGTGADAGPPSDFSFSHPFLEFAIRNPGSASQREIAGMRLGGEVFGKMSLGRRPSGTDNNPANHVGINSFSGDIRAFVNNAQLPVSLCLIGSANSDRTGCNFGGSIPMGFATINTDQPNTGDNIFNLVLNRQGTGANSPTLSPVVAVALGLLSLNADFTEDLRFVHSLQMGDDTNGNGRFDPGEGTKDFFLSLQKESIRWPKVSNGTYSTQAAQRGWWMSIPKVILGDFTARRVYAGTLEAIGTLLGGPHVKLSNVDLNQIPVDNCWGTLNFC